MLSIKIKIVLAYTLIFGILLSLFAFVIYQSTQKASLAKLDSKLKNYSILIQSEIEEQNRDNKSYNYYEFKTIQTDGLKGARFQLFDANDKIIIGDTIFIKLDSGLLNSLLKGSEKFEGIRNNKHWARIYYSSIEIREKTNHVLVVSSSLEEVHEDLERLILLFIIIIPASLILAGISAFLIAKKAFRPISKMIVTANEISAYSLDKRLIIPGTNDEVKALSITLNSMIERLDKTFRSHRQFIADASHEIRTPLTVIQTELELSLKGIKDIRTIESIKTSLNEIENLGKLTNSLLTLAKIDASKNIVEITKVRLDELVLECVQLMNWLAQQRKNTVNILIDDVFEIEGDRDKLKSIILNLLENAIKYSGENKEIKIELKKRDQDYIDIIICDNGAGISEKDIPHIFERFYRSNDTRSLVDGNGLGLAIVKEFVEMHNGKISVISIPGETVFDVTLPLSVTL